jgi:hypothetical protein
MKSELQRLRERLTPDQRPASHRFCSIEVQGPGAGGDFPTVSAGQRLSFCLQIEPAPPKCLAGYVFAEGEGRLVARLEPIEVVEAPNRIACSFTLPPELPRQLCFIIEAAWSEGPVAGCEMSFQVAR